jgi:ATP-binding cassette, subfamily B, bacterial
MLMLTTGLLMVAAAIASVTYPLGIVLMVEAIGHNSSSGEIAGVVVVATLFWCSWALMVAGAMQASVLTDRLLIHFTTKIATRINAAQGIAHLEQPDHLAHIDHLAQHKRTLAMGPQHALVLLQMTVRTAIICALLASIYAPLALLVLAGVPPFLADRKATAITDDAEQHLAEKKRLAGALFRLTSSASSAKELRIFDLRRELITRTRRLNDQLTSTASAAATRAALWSAAGWATYGLGFAGAIAVIALRAANGETRAAQLILAVALLRRAQLSISQVSDTTRKLSASAACADHLLWLEDYASSEHRDHSSSVSPIVLSRRPVPSGLRSGVRLVDLSFSYPDAHAPVIDQLNLDLACGQSVAIVGENGAGKSTLVKLITGMYRPCSGRILLDGIDLSSIDLGDWRSRCSAVFQDFVRYDLTVGDNVGVGDLPSRADHRAVESAIASAGGAKVLTQLPAGIATRLGWSFDDGHNLSAGQWQTLALSRGMMRPAPLLVILDEPTGNLDAVTEHALFTRHLRYARGTASRSGTITLLISHRFSTVRAADLIAVMDGGRIIEQGDHATLMAAEGAYADMFRLQADAYR